MENMTRIRDGNKSNSYRIHEPPNPIRLTFGSENPIWLRSDGVRSLIRIQFKSERMKSDSDSIWFDPIISFFAIFALFFYLSRHFLHYFSFETVRQTLQFQLICNASTQQVNDTQILKATYYIVHSPKSSPQIIEITHIS